MKFWVVGTPVTKGSMSVFNGRIVHSSKSKAWEKKIRKQVLEQLPKGYKPTDKPVDLVYSCFYLPRPKSVPLRKRQWPYKRSAGDIDKHLRCLLDALTDVIWLDDSQVVSMNAVKFYDDRKGPGVEFEIHIVE